MQSSALKDPRVVLVKSISIKLFKFGIAGGLIYWMVRKGLLDFSVFSQLLEPVSISLCAIFLFLNISLVNYRWSLLLRSQGLPSEFRVTFPLTLIGIFFNFSAPGSIGGDLVKGYYVTQNHPERRMTAATTVVMDRILGFYAMLLLAIVTILFNLPFVLSKPALIQVAMVSVGALVAKTVVLAMMFSSTVKAKSPLLRWVGKVPGGVHFQNLYDTIHSYGKCHLVLIKGLVLSLAAQTMAVSYMAYVGSALGEPLSISTYFFAIPLGFIIMALPVSPAGIGVGQVAFLVLFKMFTGTNTMMGQTVITVFQVGMLCWGLLGAVFYARRKKPSSMKSQSE